MNIAVLGCGNMASALVIQMYKSDPSLNFLCYTPSKTRAIDLAEKVNGKIVSNIEAFPAEIDLWIIACKPQQVRDLASAFTFKNQKMISVLAGTKCEQLKELFNTKEITRVMPNTPSQYGEGISLIYHSEEVSKKDLINNLFQSCGETLILENEAMIGELTVITGSGPGIIFYMAKYFAEELVNLNIDKDKARKLVSKLFYGSSKLMEESTVDISVLEQAVTSKAGVTESAIKSLSDSDFPEILNKAFKSGSQREKELGK